MVKVDPVPTTLVRLILPPISVANCLQMERPSPVPPNLRFSPRSPCTNGSKILSWKSGAIPGPVSCTSNANRYVLEFAGGGVNDRSPTCARKVGLCNGLMESAVPSVCDCVWLAIGSPLAVVVDRWDPDPFRIREPPARPEGVLDAVDDMPSSSLALSISPRHRMRTSIVPPAGVNLRLLLTRLIITYRGRSEFS